MRLRDFSRKLTEQDTVDRTSLLSDTLLVSDLSEKMLDQYGETVYLVDSTGVPTGKLNRNLLKYLTTQNDQRFLTQIVNNIQDGIIAVDAQGRIFYVNQAYTNILDVKAYKIIGQLIQEIEPDSLLAQSLETHQMIESPAQLIASVNKYVSLRIIPQFVHGSFVGAVSIFRDVTELHTLNKEVRKMSNIVGEYSQKLQNMSVFHSMGLLTRDRNYLNMLDQAAVVARTDVPVLIRGENGVGKEMLANYIQQCSNRKNAPLITVNCAAIPAELLESELFGYEEGAFTGALKGGKKGKFELADTGTIFLDEIGDMPLAMQSKLLRVLQYGEIEKLGRQKNLHVDLRIIAATNQPLEQLIEEKKFRQDLFFRLNIFTLQIPPLRERPNDVLLLAEHFLKHYNHKYHKQMQFTPAAYEQLLEESWPGNVRELQGCVERAVILENESLLFGRPQQRARSQPAATVPEKGFKEAVWEYEGHLLKHAIQISDGNRSRAMEMLGLSRRTFYRKCAEHDLLSKGECQ